MKYNPNFHRRRSLRLQNYDYSKPGAYFVTICVQDRECLLGEIENGEMKLSEVGKVVNAFWPKVRDHFSNVELGQMVVMPNHIHAIIFITRRGGVSPPESTELGVAGEGAKTAPLHRDSRLFPTLGKIIAYFKYETTKKINQLRDNPGVKFWQRNYYEHIIRDRSELNKYRRYIQNNPANWEVDEEHPSKIDQSKKSNRKQKGII
ncbi:MAG: transposase [bacterium]|nr:transposase [bacterium]